MKLLRLRLQNFRQHKNSDVRFGEGMTAIVGANGTGKSTLLESITFGLFGECRGTKDGVRFHHAESKKFAVILDFEVGGREYTVDRANDSASLQEGPKVLATGLGPVTKACEQLLGLTYLQFTASFVAEQKSLEFLSSMKTNAGRQEEIARMLGLDQIKQAEELSTDRRKEAKAKREALDQNLGDPAQLQSDKDQASKDLAESDAAIAGIKAAALKTDEAAPVAKANSDHAVEWRRLTDELSTIRVSSAGLKERVALTLAEKEAAEKFDRAPIDAEIGAIGVVDVQEITARLEAKKAEIETARADYRAKAQSRLKQWNAALSAHSAAKSNREHAEKDLGVWVAKLESGTCPSCGQPFGEGLQASIDAKRGALKDLIGAEAIAKKAMDEVSASDAAEDDTKALQPLSDELQKISSELSSATGTIRHKQQLETQLKTAETNLNTRTEAWEAAARALAAAKEEYRALDEARTKLPIKDAVGADAAREVYSTLLNDQVRHRGDLASAERFRAMHAESLERADKQLAAYAAQEAQLAEVKQSELLNETTAREMKALRIGLNASIGPDLAARASENLSLLTGGRYPVLTLDGNFNPSLLDNGISKSVISGGEEDAVALSLRLALSELIQERQGRPMSLLILDEVFGSLDAERRQAVLDRLSALRGRFDQILVISHIEGINEVADRCIYLTRDTDTMATIASDGMPEPLELELSA